MKSLASLKISLCLILFLPSCTLAHAQTTVSPVNQCNGMISRKTWPSPGGNAIILARPSEDRGLYLHGAQDPEVDTSTASSFEASRSFQKGNTLYLAVCSAKVLVRTSSSVNRLHISIRLRRELPKGRTVADYISQFSVDSKQAEFQFKAPKEYRPEIAIEVPEATASEIELGVGSIEFHRIPGDLNISLAKGNTLLHSNSKADYASISASTGIGGTRDKRPGGKSTGHLASLWHEQAQEPTGSQSPLVGEISSSFPLVNLQCSTWNKRFPHSPS